MRAVSFVEHFDFEFNGSVLRNGLTLGDVDNDGNVELVVGNEDGDVCVFKGNECWQTIHGVGFVACVVIGDLLNRKENSLVIVSADGWCHIYHTNKKSAQIDDESYANVLEQLFNTEEPSTAEELMDAELDGFLKCVHTQRIPTDTKVALLGDIDNDGAIELVLGLTDRVVRSYRWINDETGSSSKRTNTINNIQGKHKKIVELLGKLVGLNKWECANQIGSVTLHHSADGLPCLLVAQPGGTFMRIKSHMNEEAAAAASETNAASLIDYQFLGLSRMRNQNISTEIVGDLNTTTTTNTQQDLIATESTKSKPYTVATLDGTILLVQDEVILWAIQVDHQTFALNKLDVTGNGCDDIVVCSWDGQTYILDQNKNSVRFHLDQPVQAFCTGQYSVVPSEKPVPCFVYVTFSNKVLLYYDIQLPSITIERFNPDLTKCNQLETLYQQVQITDEDLIEEGLSRKTKQKIVEYLLYGVQMESSNE